MKYGNKIISYYNDALKIKRGEMPIPRMALFCPSAKCSLKCYYCDYPEDNNGEEMDSEIAFDLVKQLHDYGVRGIDFCGGGEPLSTSYAYDLLYYIRELGMEFGILSNGVNFKDELMKIIVREGRYIRISLDNAVPEAYRVMKGVDRCELVKDNIVKALAYKKETGSKCEISVKLGISEKNIDIRSLSLTYAWLKTLDLSSIQVKMLRNIGEKDISTDVMNSIYKTLESYEMASVQEGKEWVLNFNDKKSSIDCKCWLSPIHTVIMADGNVYLCCYFQSRREEHCIGNIHKQSFKEIWESERHKEAIANIQIDKCNVYDCKFHGHHKKMDDFMINGDPEHI